MNMTIVQRSERVAFPIPIQYRRPGDTDWSSSTVVNLSDSGILFGSTQLQAGTFIELVLSPPIRAGWLTPGKQVCAGEVVRAVGGTVAVRLGECRFSV
jgi:hypothetical protein